MECDKKYQQWLEHATADPDLALELKEINGKNDEILDRFYRDLEFGTAGLRGVIGAGTNRMNVYTVGRATQGLADFLHANYENPSVAIAYDSRIKSDYFSKFAAEVLAANNIKVYIFPELVPTPMLSYAVRCYKASSGIIITASHNPAEYNGYKCYNPNGYQMTDDEADETYSYIQKVDYFTGIRRTDFDSALASGIIEYIPEEVNNSFLNEVQKQCLNPSACKNADLSVIYTPLNGTGNKPVREILKRCGIEKVAVVPEQEMPDGSFPTCPFPNSEIREAFKCALELAKKSPADLLLATDPDCDRVGIAVLCENGEYTLMSGNEVGVMLLNYILSQKKENGTLSQNAIAAKSFVSTELASAVAKSCGCKIKNLLTGFKYIGEVVTQLERQGRADDFVMGFEESYGYLAGTHARDKDAVVASMLICEMASYYKLQGKRLTDVMAEIYNKFGHYCNVLRNYAFKGASGMEKMASLMDSLRTEPPKEFADMAVTDISDYKSKTKTNILTGEQEKISLPSANVLSYKMQGGHTVIIRPSGTEPKIKAYITAIGKDEAESREISEKLAKAADLIMNS